MDHQWSTTIVLPKDLKNLARVKAYLEWIAQYTPADRRDIRFAEQLAVYVQIIFLRQLLAEGAMLNTKTFYDELTEIDPSMHRVLEDNPYVYGIACRDLAEKISLFSRP